MRPPFLLQVRGTVKGLLKDSRTTVTHLVSP